MIRRAIAATVAGFCALAGPAAAPVLAVADPTVTLSSTSLRPGVVFTITPQAACPEDSGSDQEVQVDYLDHDGDTFAVGTVPVEDDGSWVGADLTLPAGGLQPDGSWLAEGPGAGSGTIRAACGLPDENGSELTQSYAPVAVTVTGAAARLTVSDETIEPGDELTVTPADPCPAAGTVQVTLVTADPADDPDDPSGDDPDSSDDPSGDDPSGDDPAGDGTDVTLSTGTDGSWAPVLLTLPDDAGTGDYLVSADCSSSAGDPTGSYRQVPVAVGTVLIGTPACSARRSTVPLTGTYAGSISLPDFSDSSDDELTLPVRLRLTGNRPWRVAVRSALTGQLLASASVTCPPRYELDVPRYGFSSSGALQVRVCNTGNATATGRLQTWRDRHWTAADDESLEAATCTWLATGKVRRGATVTARLLIDAPGKGADAVVQEFRVRRPRD